MSQIRDITIEGYRSIASIKELELRPLNILIGANGSGKSNFLGALEFLGKMARVAPSFHEHVQRAGGADRLLHYGSKTTPAMNFAIRFHDGLADFNAEIQHGAEDQLYPVFKVNFSPEYFASRESKNRPMLPPKEWKERVGGWRHFHFHDTGRTSPIKRQANLHDNRELRSDGENLAAFLYLLREKHEDAYDFVEQTIKSAAPFFDGFVLKPLEYNQKMILLEWGHKGSDAYFDASSISDGTLRFIALTTLLLQPESLRPSLILLDEPELGLHPYAITLLASMLKQASGDSQVIVATQSPILLDHFNPEDVLVADRVNGATVLKRLDAKRLADWLEDYSLGQLWEKNELGGRPMPETLGGPSQE